MEFDPSSLLRGFVQVLESSNLTSHKKRQRNKKNGKTTNDIWKLLGDFAGNEIKEKMWEKLKPVLWHWACIIIPFLVIAWHFVSSFSNKTLAWSYLGLLQIWQLFFSKDLLVIPGHDWSGRICNLLSVSLVCQFFEKSLGISFRNVIIPPLLSWFLVVVCISNLEASQKNHKVRVTTYILMFWPWVLFAVSQIVVYPVIGLLLLNCFMWMELLVFDDNKKHLDVITRHIKEMVQSKTLRLCYFIFITKTFIVLEILVSIWHRENKFLETSFIGLLINLLALYDCESIFIRRQNHHQALTSSIMSMLPDLIPFLLQFYTSSSWIPLFNFVDVVLLLLEGCFFLLFPLIPHLAWNWYIFPIWIFWNSLATIVNLLVNKENNNNNHNNNGISTHETLLSSGMVRIQGTHHTQHVNLNRKKQKQHQTQFLSLIQEIRQKFWTGFRLVHASFSQWWTSYSSYSHENLQEKNITQGDKKKRRNITNSSSCSRIKLRQQRQRFAELRKTKRSRKEC